MYGFKFIQWQNSETIRIYNAKICLEEGQKESNLLQWVNIPILTDDDGLAAFLG